MVGMDLAGIGLGVPLRAGCAALIRTHSREVAEKCIFSRWTRITFSAIKVPSRYRGCRGRTWTWPPTRLGWKRCKSGAKRRAGHLHQSDKRLAQIQYQKDCNRSGQREDKKGSYQHWIWFGEKAEAGEDDR